MATETLRPNAAGDETNIEAQFPNSDFHYDKVDEEAADDGTTFVFNSTNAYQRDLYALPASSGAGTISKITVYFRCNMSLSTSGATAKASIKSNSTVTDGDEESLTAGAWETFSKEWVTNPADGEDWEWTDIDALQIGVSLKSGTSGATPKANCTQVYGVVTYIPPDPILVTPPTLVLTLTLYAPTVSTPRLVTPSTLALTLTSYVPVIGISDNQKVIPSTLALSLTTYAPTVLTPRLVTPSTLALSLTTFEPTVTATDHQIATPTTLVLILTEYAPEIEIKPVVITGGRWGWGGGFPAIIYPPRRERPREKFDSATRIVQGQPATLPEYIVSKVLDKMGINYIFQRSFLGGRTQAGGIIADYYLPSYSMIISILGTYWHASPEVRAKDLLQRISVLSQGIMTIFINEADVMKRARYYVEQALLGFDHSGIKL